ncbi:Mov34/MPN/PAD-1 family protein [Geoalkalibacter ferrihydriticus]|uniref:Mov34/MPN/PAD-1 family protein n=1 Tax=Geoalkalibacter ferrihydriticus TaxID=392333 RepID=UPI000942B2A4
MILAYSTETGGPLVILNNEVVASLVRHRQLSAKDKEAGGQLFARFDGGNTIIVEATEPKLLDRRGRYGFLPNRLLQRQEIKARHKKGRHFVGDWHTHPQPIPSPSGEDIRSMVDCFRKSRHELKTFLMIIVGTEEPPEGLLVCLVNERGVLNLRCVPL